MKEANVFRWPALDTLKPDKVTPPEYKYRSLARDEVSILCELILTWYPDISVGAGKSYTTPLFYEQEVSFSEDDGKHTIVYAGKYNGDIIGAIFLQINPASRTMYSRFAVSSPDHRGSGASLFAGYVMDALAEKMGLSMNYMHVSLKNRAMQQLVERAGFKPVGIIPFSDVELDSNRQPQHIVEALYVKTYLPPHLLLSVNPDNLTPMMQKVWMSISEHTDIFSE